MRQVLLFRTGKTTCSEQPAYPGSLCPFVYSKSFGTKFVCQLYGGAPLADKDGWLQRLPQCIKNHKGISDFSPIDSTEDSSRRERPPIGRRAAPSPS